MTETESKIKFSETFIVVKRQKVNPCHKTKLTSILIYFGLNDSPAVKLIINNIVLWTIN